MARKPTGRRPGRPERWTLDEHYARLVAIKAHAAERQIGIYRAVRELGWTSPQYDHSRERLRAAGVTLP
jgi:hypothetical protein